MECNLARKSSVIVLKSQILKHTDMPGEFIPILLGLGLFIMIFGLRYLHNKERMAMIQNGMDPHSRQPRVPIPQPYNSLKIGLLLMGAGIGLFFAYFLDEKVFVDGGDANVALYFALIGFFGGLGLFISYLIEKKEILDKRND